MKKSLWFLLSLFLSCQTIAATGSIPATPSTTEFNWSGQGYSPTVVTGSYSTVAAAMCPAGIDLLGNGFHISNGSYSPSSPPNATGADIYCLSNSGGSRSPGTIARQSPLYTCPSGYVLNGQMCDPVSACEQVKGLINGTPQATRWYMVPVGSSNATGAFCDSGCAANLAIAGTGYYTDGKMNSFQRQIMYTGQSCTNEPNAPQQFTPEKAPPVPEKKPPCAAGEGVMTSSSGTIACVPEGTPNSKPPVVTKQAETKTNADGTTTTTESTTTRDPSTGAEQKTSTSTTKDGNGNVTGVTSSTGTSGTTNGGNPEKPGDSDFCQKNPTLDICTGKLNKEETQKKIADDIKSLINPGDTSTDPLKNATHTTASENQLKTENDKFTDAAKGITDPTASSKSSWQQAMESGWFSAIPSSGCTPITGTVGGRQFTIDHCEKASQISDIMSYALWFMLVVGSFVMFTGGQVRTQ